jgi:hypothetical protein
MPQLITYKSGEWSIENIGRSAARFAAQGFVTDTWGVLKDTALFDRVFLLRQGGKPEERVIFGIGEVLDEPRLMNTVRGKRDYQSHIRFTRFVDPRHGNLLDAVTTRAILGDDVNARQSGRELSDEKVDALDKALVAAKHQARLRSA